MAEGVAFALPTFLGRFVLLRVITHVV